MTGWKKTQLGKICKLINGRAYKKQELLSEGKYLVLRVGNFFSNRSWYYSDLELNEDKYCDKNDLLYAWSASFGPRVWHGEKVIYHYHIWKVKIDIEKVDKKFLFYWFEWDKEQIKKEQGVGTTMIHVTKGAMEKRKLIIPSLKEQKLIVKILDKAFEGIAIAEANTKKNLANACELFEQFLNNNFTQTKDGWEVKRISDVSTNIEYGSSSKSLKNPTSNSIPVLRMGNMQGGLIDWDDLVYTDKEDEIKKYFLKYNDILFNRTNSDIHVGKTAIYKSERPAIFAGYLIRINYKKNIVDPDFLNFYLNSSVARDYGKSVMSRSINQANINGTKLKTYPIYLPSLEIQKEVVSKLHELQKQTKALEKIYQQKLKALAELKQSILQKAFTGQLTT